MTMKIEQYRFFVLEGRNILQCRFLCITIIGVDDNHRFAQKNIEIVLDRRENLRVQESFVLRGEAPLH